MTLTKQRAALEAVSGPLKDLCQAGLRGFNPYHHCTNEERCLNGLFFMDQYMLPEPFWLALHRALTKKPRARLRPLLCYVNFVLERNCEMMERRLRHCLTYGWDEGDVFNVRNTVGAARILKRERRRRGRKKQQ